MANHRFQADESCEVCHGEIEFGTDDSSFCANSACHGQAWPEVQLNAAFPHPIELTGQHTEVWCHNCHEGVEKPEFVCANCHEPPTEPHFGETCENCHTTEGFEDADMGDFEHPIPLEGQHATLDCLACHTAGFDLTYECAACHEPPTEPHFGETCEDCHTPEGFGQVSVEDFQHPVPLEGQHASLDCDACHAGATDLVFECAACHEPPTEPHFGETCEDCHTPAGFEQVTVDDLEHPVPLEGEHADLDCQACHAAVTDLVYECDTCHQPPEDHFEARCDTCHTPQGWVESASFLTNASSKIPHPLEGRDNCLVCHDPDGGVEPAPANHTVYAVEQCTLCHKSEP